MGPCLSCLGQGRSSYDAEENPETRRLLSNDPYRAYNGLDSRQARSRAAGEQHLQQPDPEVARREQQALESICQTMNDQVLDVFVTLPPPTMVDSEESSAAHSMEHLHLAMRKPAKSIPHRDGEEDEEDSEDAGTEEGEEEDEDSLDDEEQDESDPESPTILVQEQPEYRQPTPYSTVTRLKAREAHQYLNKEDSEAARLAMG